jgi:hypothetical protein
MPFASFVSQEDLELDQAWLHQRPHLAPLARRLDEVLRLADEQYEQGRASGDAVDYGAFEERVARATYAKFEQDVHQIVLSGLDVDVPFIRVWGKHYCRVHRIERTYGSLSGPVIVERTLYRELGQRQGPALDPIAVRASVVDGSWLPRTARAIAHLMSQVTSREAEVTGRELMRLPYSRSSIERVGHAVGAEYLSRRENVEPKLIEACELPPGIASVSVSVDRVTVPMEEPVPKEPEGTGPPVRLRKETLRKYGHLCERCSRLSLFRFMVSLGRAHCRGRNASGRRRWAGHGRAVRGELRVRDAAGRDHDKLDRCARRGRRYRVDY